jgi:hypothetical protein
MKKIHLNGVKMTVIDTAGNGVVGIDTVFVFKQKQQVVTAKYKGGEIANGFLVGKLNKEVLEFAYCQIQKDGTIDHGTSTGILEWNNAGKLQLTETFVWGSRDDKTGVNVFQEV